jgi:hypothetical protein
VRARALEIGQTVERIFKESRAQGITPDAAARHIAEAALTAGSVQSSTV